MSNADIYVSGNLTADPELKFSKNGAARLSFSIASNRRYQVDGEWQDQTSFFNITAWGNLAEQASNIIEKGMPLLVKGRLEQRTWEDSEGGKRSTVEVIADAIAVHTFAISSMERRRGNARNTAGDSGEASPQPRNLAAVPSSDPFEDF